MANHGRNIKNPASLGRAAKTLLYPIASYFLCLSSLAFAHHDIPRLSDNLARAAEGLEPALRNGSPEELKDAIANLLQSYRAMEGDVEHAYKEAGGGARDHEVAKANAKKYYDLVDRIWKDGVGGKEAANIKANDLAKGAGAIGRAMRRLSRQLDFSKLADVDRILAHAEAILIMGEDLDLVAFGASAAAGRRPTSASAPDDENSSSSEEESTKGQI